MPSGNEEKAGGLPAIELVPNGYKTAMVACYLPKSVADSLYLGDTRDDIDKCVPGEMHMTLAFLGDMENLPEDTQNKLVKAVGDYCAKAAPLNARLNGYGRFSSNEGEDTCAVYANVDCPALHDFRSGLVKCIKAAGVPFDDIQDHGFTPHVTLCYIPRSAPMPEMATPDAECNFGHCTLCFGDKRMHFKLANTGDIKEKNLSIKSVKTDTSERKSIKVEFKALPGETVVDGQPGILIEGWASVRYPEDRYGDVIGPTDEVFRDAVLTYFELNPILLYEHGLDPIIGNKPLGQVVDYKFTDYGLMVKAFIARPVWEPMLQIYLSIKSGVLRTFSIGGIWSRSGAEIVKADLFEISVVATPAQPMAVFDLATKSFGLNKREAQKVATGLKELPLAQKRKAIAAIAEASLDYWAGQAKAALKAPYKSEIERKNALRRTGVRLALAVRYFDKASN